MRFRLRTLLIVLAIGPPLLAWGGSWAYGRYQKRRDGLAALRQLDPNAKLARPVWWIFETPVSDEL
ncbi:MAG TPA: hypothetical protein VGI40_17950 [Pirellulaceae bacterium]